MVIGCCASLPRGFGSMGESFGFYHGVVLPSSKKFFKKKLFRRLGSIRNPNQLLGDTIFNIVYHRSQGLFDGVMPVKPNS